MPHNFGYVIGLTFLTCVVQLCDDRIKETNRACAQQDRPCTTSTGSCMATLSPRKVPRATHHMFYLISKRQARNWGTKSRSWQRYVSWYGPYVWIQSDIEPVLWCVIQHLSKFEKLNVREDFGPFRSPNHTCCIYFCCDDWFSEISGSLSLMVFKHGVG